MTKDSIYGGHLPEMEEAMYSLQQMLEQIREEMKEKLGMDPVEHCLARIKTEDSMREKCRRRGFPENEHSALELIHDGIGIRIVCPFIDDVYQICHQLKAKADRGELEVAEEKDYIRHVKPNGYRSLHLIVKYRGYYAEIQLRTISMDTWAALEHHIRYKKNLKGDPELIAKELKRCADELASTDLSMQTIRDMAMTGL